MSNYMGSPFSLYMPNYEEDYDDHYDDEEDRENEDPQDESDEGTPLLNHVKLFLELRLCYRYGRSQ